MLVLMFGYFFRPYTIFTFRAEAINTFFTIKTNDESLKSGCNKLHLSFCNKVRIIFGICPDIKLKRLLYHDYKGDHMILKELDMVRIVNELKFLKDITRNIDPMAHINFPTEEIREIDIDVESDSELPPMQKLKRRLSMSS